MDVRRVGGVAALIAGVALVAVGAVGALGTGRGTAASSPAPSAAAVVPSATPAGTFPSSPTASPTAGPTASPSVAAPSSAAPSATQAPSVEAFYAVLVPAIRTKDVATLGAKLHPATIERYGDAACRAYFGALNDPAFNVVVHEVRPPAAWDYVTDGRTTTIPDAWEVAADLTSQGKTEVRTLHVALVDGEIRWFTDCGTPLAASPAP